MKNKTILATLVFFFFIFETLSHGESQNREKSKQIELENYLRTAKIVSINKNKQVGRTVPWIITLDDGKIVRHGFFKHVNRQRPTLLPDSYQYEIAAYELDKLLDLNIVPPVVEREVNGTKGSLAQFIEDSFSEEDRKRRKIEPPDLKGFQNTLEEINIFESLTYNERDTGDILIQRVDWKVWRVDFGQAFDSSSELIPGCKIIRCSKKLYQNLRELDNNKVKARLKQYLNDEEIRALLNRKNIITEKIKQLVEKEGEDSVLFH